MSTCEPLPAGWQYLRRVPALVPGIQWNGGNTAEILAAVPGCFRLCEEPDRDAEVYDSRHKSWIGLHLGDWVMLGPGGETWPVEDSAFPALYERATETPAPVVVGCGLAPLVNETWCLHWYRSAADASREIREVLTVTRRTGLTVPAGANLTGCEDWARAAARAAVAMQDGRFADAALYATHRLGMPGEPYLVEVAR